MTGQAQRWLGPAAEAGRCACTALHSSSRNHGPLASSPESNGFLRLHSRGALSSVLTKPPELATKAAPAATSHSFFGVSVKVMSARPAATSPNLYATEPIGRI